VPFCAKCGTEYQIGNDLCAYCSGPLQTSEEAIADSDQSNERQIQTPKMLRIFAGIIDILVVVGLTALLLSPRLRFLSMVGMRRIISFGAPSLYLLLKDCIDGKSIGKLVTGLTTFNIIEKKPTGFADSILRNWYLGIPLLGPTVFSGIAFIQIMLKNKRWGDGMAKTVILKDKNLERL